MSALHTYILQCVCVYTLIRRGFEQTLLNGYGQRLDYTQILFVLCQIIACYNKVTCWMIFLVSFFFQRLRLVDLLALPVEIALTVRDDRWGRFRTGWAVGLSQTMADGRYPMVHAGRELRDRSINNIRAASRQPLYFLSTIICSSISSRSSSSLQVFFHFFIRMIVGCGGW